MTDTDPYAVVGDALADALAILADEFGLEGEIPDGASIAASLRAMEGKPDAAPESAPPVEPVGKAWHEGDAIEKAWDKEVMELAAEMAAEIGA